MKISAQVINIWLQIQEWKSNSLFKSSRLFMRRQSGRNLKLVIQLPVMQILGVYHSLSPIPNTFYNSHFYASFFGNYSLCPNVVALALEGLGALWKEIQVPGWFLSQFQLRDKLQKQLVENRFERCFGTELCADRSFAVVLRNWQDVTTVLVQGWVALLAIIAIYNIQYLRCKRL